MSHIIVRTAKPGESKHANEVIHRSFNSMGAHGDPFPPDNHIVLAELDGKLVGHTSIRPFKFHLGTGVVTGNALHMVGTDPGYQHRGIGHAMMDKVIEISRASNHVFSVLETPVPRFYAMKGWELIGPRYGITIDRASLQSSASRHEPSRPGVTLEDVTPDDLPGLLLLREGFGSEKWLFSWANDIYMARLHEEHAPGVARFFHKILDGGRLVGYLYGNRDTSTEPGKPLGITVLEWIMDGAYAHSIKDVLGHLLSFDDEFSTIFVKFKIDPWMEDAIVNLGGKVTGASGNVEMIRVMSWEVVLGVTLPFIARGLTEHARARGAVPPRPLLLVIGDERVGFDMHASDSPSAGAIQVEMRSPGDLAGRDAGGRVTFATDHATMTHVFLGNVPPSELVGDGLATCSDHGTLPQLDAMFGPRPVVLNYNTHFFKAHFPG